MDDIVPVNPVTVVTATLKAQGMSEAMAAIVATHVLGDLARAGVEVLDGCHRCGADASEHWCADLEETFN